MASLLIFLLLGYLTLGLLVGLGFVLVGVGRVDPVAAGSPMRFRVVILPGCVGLWPVVLWKWMRAGKAGGT